MLMKDCAALDEVYTHIDPDTGEVRHFNATKMSTAAEYLNRMGHVELLTAAMDPEFIDLVKRCRGTEAWKIARLVEPYLSRPIIGVRMHDDTVLTVDGHHRLVVLHSQGAETYRIFVFPMNIWEGFLITDIPASLEAHILDEVTSQGNGG